MPFGGMIRAEYFSHRCRMIQWEGQMNRTVVETETVSRPPPEPGTPWVAVEAMILHVSKAYLLPAELVSVGAMIVGDTTDLNGVS
jgi:hypothetical protein